MTASYLNLVPVVPWAQKQFPISGSSGFMNPLRLVQNYSAVTAACLVIRKSTFEEVGALDEGNLAVSFNDVDFCLLVLKAGYRSIWTPFADLYHHESTSSDPENSPEKKARAARKVAYMRETWGPLLDSDPAHNSSLTVVHEDFSFAWPPRSSALPSS